MDYEMHYNKLVERAKTRSVQGYAEKHRIVPGCMGGSYTDSNVVMLTPEEHYVAHQLLVKMYPSQIGLVDAARIMTFGSRYTDRTNNKLYGWLKRRFAQKQSMVMKGNSINLGRKQSQEHIAKLSAVRKGRKVWNKGLKGVQVAPNKGKKGQFGWFTNGTDELYIKITEAPVGWQNGRSCKNLGGRKIRENELGGL